MLDLKLIRSQPKEIAENCRIRNVDVDIEKLLVLDEQVRQITTEIDSIREKRNDISDKIKDAISSLERQPLINESKDLREQESSKEEIYRQLLDQRLAIHKQVPNLTHPDSPEGFSDEDNLPIKEVGIRPEFNFEPKDHLELMENLYYMASKSVCIK